MHLHAEKEESHAHCNVLDLGLGDCIVGLSEQMSWQREVALLPDSPDMVNGAAQHFQTKTEAIPWPCDFGIVHAVNKDDKHITATP